MQGCWGVRDSMMSRRLIQEKNDRDRNWSEIGLYLVKGLTSLFVLNDEKPLRDMNSFGSFQHHCGRSVEERRDVGEIGG